MSASAVGRAKPCAGAVDGAALAEETAEDFAEGAAAAVALGGGFGALRLVEHAATTTTANARKRPTGPNLATGPAPVHPRRARRTAGVWPAGDKPRPYWSDSLMRPLIGWLVNCWIAPLSPWLMA